MSGPLRTPQRARGASDGVLGRSRFVTFIQPQAVKLLPTPGATAAQARPSDSAPRTHPGAQMSNRARAHHRPSAAVAEDEPRHLRLDRRPPSGAAGDPVERAGPLDRREITDRRPGSSRADGEPAMASTSPTTSRALRAPPDGSRLPRPLTAVRGRPLAGQLRRGDQSAEHRVDEPLLAGRRERQLALHPHRSSGAMGEPHERALAVIVQQLVRIDLPGAADGALRAEHPVLDVDADVERPAADLNRKPRW